MSGMKKNILYVRHILMMVFSNIPRLILSVSGLFVGLLILTVGSILVNSYYDECMNKVNEYADNTLLLKVGAEEEFKNVLIEKIDVSEVERKMVSSVSETIYVKPYTNNYYCVLNANIVGTTSMGSNNVLLKYSENTAIPVKATLVSGRWIDEQDIVNNKNVVVIDDFTADLLFGGADSVGKFITMGVTESGIAAVSENNSLEEKENKEYEVIGVFKNSEVSKQNQLDFEKFRLQGNANLTLNSYIYIPQTVFADKYYSEEKCDYLIWNCKDDKDYNKKIGSLRDYESVYVNEYYQFEITSKEDLEESLRNELMPLKIFMWLIMIFLLIISGINSMNTMFFSVKERMGEIGIKKAMGATKSDIIVQFLLEGVFMAYLAAVIAVVLGGILSKFIGAYIQSALYISFPIVYTFDTILLTFIVAGVYGMAFSFVPSYYGANTNVTVALRFE